MQERNKLLAEKRLLLSRPVPDREKVQEIDEELERVETETDLQSEAIQARQEEVRCRNVLAVSTCLQLLSMEGAGMRSFASVDELSEESTRTIRSTGIDEARPLLKEMLVTLVKQQIESDRQRVKVKEIEAELKKKDAILKAFLSKGASTTDAAPQLAEHGSPSPDDGDARVSSPQAVTPAFGDTALLLHAETSVAEKRPVCRQCTHPPFVNTPALRHVISCRARCRPRPCRSPGPKVCHVQQHLSLPLLAAAIPSLPETPSKLPTPLDFLASLRRKAFGAPSCRC